VFVQAIIHFLIAQEKNVLNMVLFAVMMLLVKEIIMVIIHVNVLDNGQVLIAQRVRLFFWFYKLSMFDLS
jgi:hypothetical protein